MVEEILKVDIISPSQSSNSALMVLVHNKRGPIYMCLYYRELNKITVKYKFPIPINDELLDEPHGVVYYTKLDLCLGYHQIIMKEEEIPKTTFITHEVHHEFLGPCLLDLRMHLPHFKVC